MKKLFALSLFVSTLSFSQTPCEDGQAGDFDCLGIDLQSRITVIDLGAEEIDGRWLNDIWGWVDPETNKEYALVGMTNGTSFVDISDPVNPIVLGILLEHNSIATTQPLHDGAKSVWRDIKVFDNHAYIVSEDPGHGMQVFDLTDLRDVVNAPVQFNEAGHYNGIGKAHNLVINEETGFAYAVGFNANDDRPCSIGGMHIIDLSDPKNPSFAGCFDEDGYTHDAQCVIYRGPDIDYQGKEICFNSNEDEVVIVDVTDKNSPSLISKNGYADAQYTHQGWLTEDHKYFLSNDELDELFLARNTRTFIWDVQDLDEPVLLGFYEHANQAIDHNLYTFGKYVFESNYTNGLRVFDTTGISQGTLKEIAYFDTFKSSDATIFDGTWSNYPYFPSGNIVLSDISNGLFVLKMQSLFIEEQPQNEVACIGEHLDIPVSAQGENIEYQWQIDEGDGFKNIDDFERYKNTTTSAMHAHTLELSQNGNQFRCILSNGISEIITDPMTLMVLDSPKAEFSYGFTTLDGTIIFNNNSENANNFQWSFGDGQESSEASPTYQYQAEGQYEIRLIASNDCTADTVFQSLDLLITSTEDIANQVSVYPTITHDEITIDLENSEEFIVEIYTMQGSKVLSRKMNGTVKTIPLASLAKGIYLVNVFSKSTQVLSQKIVIEKRNE